MKLENQSFVTFLIGVSLPLFFLIHFESYSLASVKIAHLWKFSLLLVISLYLLKRNHAIPGFDLYKYLLIIAILQFANQEMLANPLNAFVSFFTICLFAFVGLLFCVAKEKWISSCLFFLPFFFILSFLPYELGLIEPIGQGYDLKYYGYNLTGAIGPFQRVHMASAVLAMSLLVIAYLFFVRPHNRILLVIVFFIGLYFLFKTYVRTGMFMFFCGSVPFLIHFSSKSAVTFLKVLGFLSALFLFFSFAVVPNEPLMKRISGERISYNEKSIENLGSGRLVLWRASIEIYSDQTFLKSVLGIGETELIESIWDETKRRVFPHNGFIFLLLSNGIIGLLAFSIFICKLFLRSTALKSDQNCLLQSLLAAYVAMTFVQSYDLFYPFVLLALATGLLFKTSNPENT